jgi:hypothetical protein
MRALFLLAACAVGACSIVDDFEPRLYSANLQSQDVMNQETLLNIVRASQFEPLNFVVITQISGSQTEDLKLGLPTLTFGPQKAAAQRQFAFSGNLLDNSVVGGFQGNPLVSSAFQQGMMSPISPKVLALLIATHQREPVFYAGIAAITISLQADPPLPKYPDAEPFTVTFWNDPSNNVPSARQPNCQLLESETDQNLTFRSYYNKDSATCNYSKFVHFLRYGLDAGLTFELIQPSDDKGGKRGAAAATATATVGPPASATASVPSAASPPSGMSGQSTNATSSTAQGHICFDPAFAVNAKLREVMFKSSSRCGLGTTETVNLAFAFADSAGYALVEGQKVTPTTINIAVRSPLGVYDYLGALLRRGGQQENVQPAYHTRETKDLRTAPFLDIVADRGSGCFVSVDYGGHTYCAPQRSYSTAVMLHMLQDVRNLSITPADLNASFSVRVTN